MSNLSKTFRNLKKDNRSALITYYTFGYPTVEKSLKILEKLAGLSEVIEIGVPFSDPTADGPTIQKAHYRAVQNSIKLKDILTAVSKIKEKKDELSVVIMSYANPIWRYGVENFFKDSYLNGVDGLIVPDLSYEEREFFAEKRNHPVDIILLASPLTEKERLKNIAEKSEGFLYLVSSLGVTGERKKLDEKIEKLISKASQYSRVPVCVGFGISSPEQAETVSKYADGIIMGSAIINRININKTASEDSKNISTFLSKIRKVL